MGALVILEKGQGGKDLVRGKAQRGNPERQARGRAMLAPAVAAPAVAALVERVAIVAPPLVKKVLARPQVHRELVRLLVATHPAMRVVPQAMPQAGPQAMERAMPALEVEVLEGGTRGVQAGTVMEANNI